MDISELHSLLTALMMEAASTSETSICFYLTAKRKILEGCIFILAAVRISNLK
jgi:hypothetical protein